MIVRAEIYRDAEWKEVTRRDLTVSVDDGLLRVSIDFGTLYPPWRVVAGDAEPLEVIFERAA